MGKTKSAKQKAAKEARKIVEMKGKQIKDELSLAMIQLFTKPEAGMVRWSGSILYVVGIQVVRVYTAMRS